MIKLVPEDEEVQRISSAIRSKSSKKSKSNFEEYNNLSESAVYSRPQSSTYTRSKFDYKKSSERLHSGNLGRKRSYGFDNVPNLVFIRENPYVREELYKKNAMEESC